MNRAVRCWGAGRRHRATRRGTVTSMTALDGKVILLTGATDGMGRALAADLARAGATVLVHGRDQARIAATVAEVAAAAGGHGRVRAYRADLASLAAVGALADQVSEAEPRLDVLVNNAG